MEPILKILNQVYDEERIMIKWICNTYIIANDERVSIWFGILVNWDNSTISWLKKFTVQSKYGIQIPNFIYINKMCACACVWCSLRESPQFVCDSFEHVE